MEIVKEIKKEKKKIDICWLLNYCGIIFIFIFLLIKRETLPEKLPLFYSLPWGEEQLVNKNFLFFLPFLSLLIMAVNFALGKILINKNLNFLSTVLKYTSLIFTLLLSFTLVKIINLVD